MWPLPHVGITTRALRHNNVKVHSFGCKPRCHEPEMFYGTTGQHDGQPCPLPWLITLPLLHATWSLSLWTYLLVCPEWFDNTLAQTKPPDVLDLVLPIAFVSPSCIHCIRWLQWTWSTWPSMISSLSYFFVLTTTSFSSCLFLVRWNFAYAMFIVMIIGCPTLTRHPICFWWLRWFLLCHNWEEWFSNLCLIQPSSLLKASNSLIG